MQTSRETNLLRQNRPEGLNGGNGSSGRFLGIVGASIDTRCICINAKATLYCSTIAQAWISSLIQWVFPSLSAKLVCKLADQGHDHATLKRSEWPIFAQPMHLSIRLLAQHVEQQSSGEYKKRRRNHHVYEWFGFGVSAVPTGGVSKVSWEKKWTLVSFVHCLGERIGERTVTRPVASLTKLASSFEPHDLGKVSFFQHFDIGTALAHSGSYQCFPFSEQKKTSGFFLPRKSVRWIGIAVASCKQRGPWHLGFQLSGGVSSSQGCTDEKSGFRGSWFHQGFRWFQKMAHDDGGGGGGDDDGGGGDDDDVDAPDDEDDDPSFPRCLIAMLTDVFSCMVNQLSCMECLVSLHHGTKTWHPEGHCWLHLWQSEGHAFVRCII